MHLEPSETRKGLQLVSDLRIRELSRIIHCPAFVQTLTHRGMGGMGGMARDLVARALEPVIRVAI